MIQVKAIENGLGEEWRIIPFADNYMASNHGRIKRLSFIKYSIKHKCFLFYPDLLIALSNGNKGYKNVRLSRKTYRAHRVTGLTFIPNPENKYEINHKDGNKKNNHVDNLEWATSSENNQHAWDMGLKRNLSQSIMAFNEHTGIYYTSVRQAIKAHPSETNGKIRKKKSAIIILWK